MEEKNGRKILLHNGDIIVEFSLKRQLGKLHPSSLRMHAMTAVGRLITRYRGKMYKNKQDGALHAKLTANISWILEY